MAKLVIKDLIGSKELDRKAMKAISGGSNSFVDTAVLPSTSIGSFGVGGLPVPYPTIGGGGTKSTFTGGKKLGGSSSIVDDTGRSTSFSEYTGEVSDDTKGVMRTWE